MGVRMTRTYHTYAGTGEGQNEVGSLFSKYSNYRCVCVLCMVCVCVCVAPDKHFV